MGFRTKLDYSDNRQIKQYEKSHTYLSGGTSFGMVFSALTVGPDLTTKTFIGSASTVISTFSGNNTTTNYTWYDARMNSGLLQLSAITPSTSATTQNVFNGYSATSSTIIDGNLVNLTYSLTDYDLTPIALYSLGGGNYSGSVQSESVFFSSAGTLDYTGRTIWVDVSGTTRTKELIIENNAVSGATWTCIDSEGKGSWVTASAATYGIWVAGTGLNSARLNGGGNIASGDYSVAEGYLTKASGKGSHAEGGISGTTSGGTASGNASHAEGILTLASGVASHAEGYKTLASGYGAHAEGGASVISVSGGTASGDASHAEGLQTLASGANSHAEGQSSIASGNNSHAEGYLTIASGYSSHSEGYKSKASGYGSHAEGGISGTTTGGTASGDASHAEGVGTLASGDISHAEGEEAIASGQTSHAEGYQTIAGGYSSHAEGQRTFASGVGSHAEGNSTKSIGVASHAEGNDTISSGTSSHAGGYNSYSNGEYSFVHGFNSVAGGLNTIVLGTNITGTTSGTTYVERLNIKTLSVYADNTAASSLEVGTVYRTATGQLMIRY